MNPPDTRNTQGNTTLRLALGIIVLAVMPILVWADGPAWWTDRDVQKPGTPPNDYAAANQGQLKNIATAAVAELKAKLPGGDEGEALLTLVNGWATSTSANDYAAVNVGQLKNVAKPFYDRLIQVGYTAQYPWTTATNAANDYAMANIGQVKNLFSFDVAFDGNGDGLPDWWESQYFGNTVTSGTALALRGDGLTNLQSYLLGLNPLDAYNSVVNPLVQPTVTLTASPLIATAPTNIVLTATATQLSGTIARIDFYQEWGYLGSANPTLPGPSFTGTISLPNLTAGNYVMSAVAVDAMGISSTASSVGLTVYVPIAATEPNRYVRGFFTDMNYDSSVIALDHQRGIWLDGTNGVVSKYPNGLPWFLRTAPAAYEPWKHISGYCTYDNAFYPLPPAYAPYYPNYPDYKCFNAPVVVGTGTVGGAPPLVAFGSQGGGSSLYINQNYNFGVVAGGLSANGTGDILIQVYRKSDFANNATVVPPITAVTCNLPRPGTSLWAAFKGNGYYQDYPLSLDGTNILLDTRVQYVLGNSGEDTWGQSMTSPLLVSHRASNADYIYRISYKGNTCGGAALVGEYFKNRLLDPSGSVGTRNASYINFSGVPDPSLEGFAGNFSARWTGWVKATTSGTYKFSVSADASDGVNLSVGGRQIISDWTAQQHTINRSSAAFPLTGGLYYPIILEYCNTTGTNAGCTLSWTAPNQSEQVIPMGQLFTLPSSPLAVAVNGTNSYEAYNLSYTLDFENPLPWQSSYIDQPHFEGVPVPSAYQGKSVDELIHNSPAVTDTLGYPASALTEIDNSRELRSHPVLEKFVDDMGRDPMALANYVLNEIDLTDAMGYGLISGSTVQLTDRSINPTGVSRDALATYLEGQGSPTEQCALLIYLLRKAGTPCGYVFPTSDGTLMFDEQLSKLLRMQLRGAKSDSTGNTNVPTLIPVNYPWVAAYVNIKDKTGADHYQWVHIFPWLKDTAVEEGYDLWSYVAPAPSQFGNFDPTDYPTSGIWLRHYLQNDPTIRSLSTEADNPGTLFPLWVKKQLQKYHPEMSIDDLGVKIYNRRNYYARWEDFPRPWQTPSVSGTNLVEKLDSIPNIFDTVNVNLFKDLGTGAVQTGQTPIITTGTLYLADLHDRRFLLYHELVDGPSQKFNVKISMEAFRPSATGTGCNFLNDATLLNKQTASAVLTGTDDNLLFQISYQRHRQLPADFTYQNPWTPFLGFGETLSIQDTRPLRKGDMAALCLDYGRVSQKMQEFQAEKYWNYQQLLSGTNAPSVADPEQSTGELLYLMGLSYYYKVSQFQEFIAGLTKTHTLSFSGHGLTKLNPQRTNDIPTIVTGTNGVPDIALRYPSVDMGFMQSAWAGSSTTHLDSGEAGQRRNDAFNLVIGEISAAEHRVINEFFCQSAAVSTVRLLDISVKNFGGFVALDSTNYLTLGATKYLNSTSTLSECAGTPMWSSITSALTDPIGGMYTTVYITPKPIALTGSHGGFFTGMGAFIIAPTQWAALISPNMNGGAGDWLSYSLPSVSSPPSYVTSSFLIHLFESWQVYNTSLATPSAPVCTPPTYSTSNFATINNAIAESTITLAQDSFNSLAAFNASIGSAPPVSYTGAQTAAAYQVQANLGFMGQPCDNRNLTFNSGATSNGITAAPNAVGDPVNIITGEFYIDAVDLSLSGPMPLEIRRNYGSLNKADNNFGQGWRMSCFPYLAFSSTDSATTPLLISAAEMDGSVIVYRRQAPPNQTLWIPTPGDNPTLANVAQGTPGGLGNVYNNQLVQSGTDKFLLNGADGSVRTYKFQTFASGTSTASGTLNRTRPYLQTWSDSRGNTYTFTSGTDSTATDFGLVRRIQSSNGDFLGFYYDTFGHIIEAYTGDGRRLYYKYDTYGDLTDVTLPDASTIHYDYSHQKNTGVNTSGYYSEHLITKETKPGGRVLVNTYEPTNWGANPTASTTRRVIQQQATAGANNALVTTGSFAYANSTVTLANGSFENPVLTGSYSLTPQGAGWNFSGRSFIQSKAWGAAAAPDGTQTVMLQGYPGYDLGSISQVVNFPVSGTYSITFQAATLPDYAAQPVKFSVDGTQVGALITPSGSTFSLFQTGTFSVTPGNHTLTFAGTQSDANKDTIIDCIQLVNGNSAVSGSTVFTDALGHQTTYVYSGGQITTITDPSQIPVTQQWYGENENTPPAYPRSLKNRTDKRGLTTSYQYNAQGNLTNITVQGNLTGGSSSTETATNTMGYNAHNLITSSTDAVGNVTNYIYGTTTGRLYLPTSVEKRAPGGSVSTTVLDYEDVVTGATQAYGLLKSQTVAAGSPDQAIRTYSHNSNGLITSGTQFTGTTDPAESITYSYNMRGEMVSETDALNRTTNYAYDARGNRMWSERHDETGALVSWQYNYYNQNGEIEWTQGPRYSPDDYVLKRYDGAGRLSEETKWRSEANSGNNGVQAPQNADAAYATAFYLHDSVGNVTEIRDVRHNSVEMGYDAMDRMTSRVFHNGGLTGSNCSTETFGYEPGGQVTTYVHSVNSTLSGTTIKFYTSTGKLKEQDNPDNTKLYWKYDSIGRVVKETLSNGNYWVTSYDDYNRTVTRTLYSGANNQPIVSGSRNVAEISVFDRRGNLISRTDLEGNTFLSAYDGLNRIKSTAGPSTNASSAQESTYHTYGAGGRVHIVADALMQNTYALNDAVGRPLLVQVKDRQNKVVRQTSYAYSPDFNSVTTTEGVGADAVSTTTFTDTYGKPLVVMLGGASSGTNAKIKRFDYDNAGNLLKSTDEQGHVTVNTYDPLNRLATQTLPGGAATTFIYDYAGNLTERHMPGGQTHYQAFDSASRKTSEYLAEASGSATRIFSYSYYHVGNSSVGLLQTTTDPRGVTATRTYDDLLRPAVVTTSGSGAQNQITTYGFDWLGRMKSVEQHYSDSSSGFTTGTSTLVQRTYDAYGHIKTEQVSIDGVLMNEFDQTWDGAGNRSSLTSQLIPQGNGAGLITAYSYWADGLLKQARVARANGSTQSISADPNQLPGSSDPSVHNFAYDTNGLLLSRKNPWRTYTVDARDSYGRVTSQTTAVGGVAVLSEPLAYRNDSKLDTYTAITTGTESRHYSYNDRGQLLSEPCLSGTLAYQFDGNVSGTGAGVRTLAKLTDTNLYQSTNVNGWQQVKAENNVQTGGTETIAWTYDEAGAVTSSSSSLRGTQTLTWDAFGRLVKVHPSSGLDWTAVYDGLGRRLRTSEQTATSGTRVIESYFDPQVEFLELGVSITTNGQFISRTWKVYGPDLNGRYGALQGIGGLEATIDEATSTVTPVVNDVFGNIVGSVAANNTLTWNPVKAGSYGVLPGYTAPLLDGTSVTVAQASVYHGYRIDPTNYYCMGERNYGPVIGRFLSADRLGHAASIDLYSLGAGDAVNNVDPTGRCSNSSSNTSSWNRGNIDEYTALNGYGESAFKGTLDEQMEAKRSAEAANEAGYRFVFSLPVASTIRAAFEFGSDKDIFTGRSVEGGDAFLNLMSSAMSDAAMILPIGGVSRGAAGVAQSTLTREAGAGVMGVAAKGVATETRMTTVIGSLEDTAKFKGQAGFNVLDVPDSVYKAMSPAEFDRLNAEWLNAALRRGDSIVPVTNPAAHAKFLEGIRPGLSSQSRYLNLELPMLKEFGVAH